MLFVRIIVSIKKKSPEKIKKYHTMSCEGILMADKRIFSRLLMIWMIISLLVWLSCTEKESTEKHPVFGRDKIENVLLIENKSEALAGWAKSGIYKAVLVNVSAEDSLAAVEHSDIEKLKTLADLKNREPLADKRGSLYQRSNYIDAALKLNLFKEIYWVLPFRYFDDIPMAGKKVKEFLKTRGVFSDADIDNMRMDFGCLKGRLSDVDISICSPRTLPFIKEPAAVSIDAGFFPLYAEGVRQSRLSAIKRFIDEFAFKSMQVIHVDISYNTEGGYTKAAHRFIGDQLFEGIKDPEVFRAELPPELWKQRDQADNMLSGGEDINVIEYLKEPLKQFPKDVPLRMLHAEANVKAGKDNESLEELKEICVQDRHYCYGFTDMGDILAEKKKYDIAEKFFLEAVKALPDDLYIIRRYVSFLENNGRAAEADAARKKFRLDR
jgi:hypothetical protein